MTSHVFVGGTGRSGTTAVARLIGQYPRHHHVDIEVKVHAVPGGLVDVAEGRTEVAAFVQRVKGEWYHRGWDGGGRGLHWLHSGRHVDRMCARFEARIADEPAEAGRLFLHDLLDPLLPADRDTIVEMTPLNQSVMPQLAAWLPTAQFVISVRDGRDVVSSVLAQSWGPSSWDEGLQWWADGMRRAHAGRTAIDATKVLTIHLEQLAGPEGEQVHDQLVEFLGVDDSEGVRNFRRHRILQQSANIGRWSANLDDDARRSVRAMYDELLGRLSDEGVTGLPVTP